MKSNIKGVTLFLLALILTMFFMRPDTSFASMYGQADVDYQKTTSYTDGESTESSSFTQGYSLGINSSLTSTISLSGEVRWRISSIDDTKTKDVFPVLRIGLSPPAMYNLSYSYNRSESGSGADRISTSNMNTAFSLPMKRWPSISFYYNRSTTQGHLVPRKRDTLSTTWGTNTDYGFTFLETATNLNYSYTNYVSEDKINETRVGTPNHSVTANLSRLFWDEKIRTSANFGYRHSKSINESLTDPVKFEQEITASRGLSRIDTTPGSGSLDYNGALIDNNTQTSAAIDLNDPDWNIGIDFAVQQPVFKIYLYIKTTSIEETAIINSTPNYFDWKLFASNTGSSWNQLTPDIKYDSSLNRFVFTFSETSAQYFKVVNKTGKGTSDINVTEIEAIGFILPTPAQTLTNITRGESGGFSLSFAPLSRMSMAYNLNYDHSNQNTDVNSFDSTSINQGINLNITIMPKYLTLSTGYSTRRTNSTQETTTTTATTTKAGTNNYSLTFSSKPLPTLNASLNYGFGQSLTNGTTFSTNHSLSGNLFMNLYTGVDLGLGSGINRTEDREMDSKTNSIHYSGNLRLKPWRPLTIVINGSISKSTTKKEGENSSSTGNSLNTTFSYTPTRRLYISSAINSSSQSYRLTWTPTSKRNIQISGRYDISDNVSNMGVSLNWYPVSRLTLQVNYNNRRTDNETNDKSDSISLKASLRF